MNIKIVKQHNYEIAVISSSEVQIIDVQSALDFIATVTYETGCHRIVLNK